MAVLIGRPFRIIVVILTVLFSTLTRTPTGNAQNYETKLKRPLAECYHGCLNDRYPDCKDLYEADDNFCRGQRIDCLNQCGILNYQGPLPHM
jgi:hypothetical protein